MKELIEGTREETYKVVVSSADKTERILITCYAMNIRKKVYELRRKHRFPKGTYYNVYRDDKYGNEAFCFSMYDYHTI